MSLPDIRARILLCVLAGYIIFNYSFTLLRVVIPFGDMALILCLATINIPVVLKKMRSAINLTPFLIWWCFGIGRAILDGVDNGLWALRDAAQVIESLWLIVAFAVAREAKNRETLFRWLKWILIVYGLYALGAPFADDIATISPSVPQAAAGEFVPIFGSYANISLMLLWIAFYLTMNDRMDQRLRIAAVATACLIIGVVVVVLQARTNYLQLAGLVCIVALFRPKNLGRFGVVIPIMFVVVGGISAFEIKVPGQLTERVSFSFFIQHLEAIVGKSQADDPGVAAAAAGVPLRLDWWTNILEQESADAVTAITGLGYGRPLTNYVASNFVGPEGVPVREPHNSFLSVLGRLGIVGAISWIWLHVELFKVWRRAFLYYRRVQEEVWISRLLLMLAFVTLVLAWSIGEDALEKPFNIVPYYCFWGVILRLGVNLAAARKPIPAKGGYYTAV